MTKRPNWTEAANLPLHELNLILEEDHDEVDDNLPTTDAQLAAAVPGKRRPGQRGPGRRPAKVLLTARVDRDVLDAWKATGADWRARINDVLRREIAGKA